MNTRRITTDMLNDPFFIGFDSLLNKMNSHTGTTQNYPPYNIVKTGEHDYRVELAVAGFSEEDLDVQVKDGVLTIEGSTKHDNVEETFLHRGIGSRSFKRTFTLADTIVVNDAWLDNGILNVKLENVIPEEKKPKKIEISNRRQLLTE